MKSSGTELSTKTRFQNFYHNFKQIHGLFARNLKKNTWIKLGHITTKNCQSLKNEHVGSVVNSKYSLSGGFISKLYMHCDRFFTNMKCQKCCFEKRHLFRRGHFWHRQKSTQDTLRTCVDMASYWFLQAVLLKQWFSSLY